MITDPEDPDEPDHEIEEDPAWRILRPTEEQMRDFRAFFDRMVERATANQPPPPPSPPPPPKLEYDLSDQDDSRAADLARYTDHAAHMYEKLQVAATVSWQYREYAERLGFSPSMADHMAAAAHHVMLHGS